MENKLVLIGGGGHCKSVIDAAFRMKIFSDIVITDPAIPIGTKIMGCEVVGADDCLEKLKDSGYGYAFITVGAVMITSLREQLADKAVGINFRFPTIIDPSAIVSDTAVIGEGSFVGKNVVVNSEVKIGRHCIINSGAIIEHECIIGDFSHVSVGAIMCGETEVGRNSLIGAGSTIIQSIHVGNNVLVGANSTVLTDVEDNQKCYGIVRN